MRKSEGKQLVSSQVHCWQEVSQAFGAPVGAAVCPGASAGASAEPSSQQPELICFVLPPPLTMSASDRWPGFAEEGTPRGPGWDQISGGRV